MARSSGSSPESVQLWIKAWEQKPIPHFKRVEHFRASDIGRKLSHGGPADLEPPIYDPREDSDDPPSRAGLASISDEDIDKLARSDLLDGYDIWFLRALKAGKALYKIERSLMTIKRFHHPEIPQSYISELSARVQAALNRDES
jgi:hypothetical protein